MIDEAKKIVDALRCCHYAPGENCAECPIDRESDCKNLEINAAELIERMAEELEQVKRERDAAVEELKLLNTELEPCAEMCSICKYSNKDPYEEPCVTCIDKKIDQWQWRGVCEENSKDGAE